MRMISYVAAVSMAVVLSGCNTVSESDFNLAKAAISESKTIRQVAMKNCVVDQARKPLSERMNGAQFMGVSLSRYPQTFCRRALNAYANGRFTYDDYKLVMRGKFNDKIIRIMKGK